MNLKLSQKIWGIEGVTAMEKLILLCLALHCNYQNETNICWPSVSTLSKSTNMSKRNVYRHLKTLEEKGIINIQKVDKTGNNFYTNVYEII